MTAKPLVWSYTLLKMFDDTCPYQGFRTYLKKDIPYKATPEMDWGNKVHEAFEHRVGGGKVLPPEMQKWEGFALPFEAAKPDHVVETEQKCGITRDGRPTEFFGADVWGRGKIDVTVIKDTTAYIADWKTGSSKYEDPFELEVGALFLKAKYPHLQKISGNYVWLKENRLSQYHDLSDVQKTWNKVRSIVTTIENYGLANEYPKKKTPLCGWCRVFDCANNTNQNREG